jgi:Periplasmic binding protein domain
VPDGTPIVNIDSPVGADDACALGIKISTYIGTDNEAAGELAADTMAGLVGRGARVGVIGGISGDATSAARIHGFRAGTRGRFDPLDPVSADWDERKAMLAATALLLDDLASTRSSPPTTRWRSGSHGPWPTRDARAQWLSQASTASSRPPSDPPRRDGGHGLAVPVHDRQARGRGVSRGRVRQVATRQRLRPNPGRHQAERRASKSNVPAADRALR